MTSPPPAPPDDGSAPRLGGRREPPAVRTREGAAIGVERDGAGIVTLRITVPGRRQNVLDGPFLEELSSRLDELDAAAPPRGVVLRSGRPGSFFAGADLDRIERLLDADADAIERGSAAVRGLFARLGVRPWPTVALIEGVCLGGGLELALACDFRVAVSSPATRLGFPEVKLGLLPGWGGTVRLPRLLGPGPAIEWIASGETFTADAAAAAGVVDASLPGDVAPAAATRLIDRAIEGGLHVERRRALAAPRWLDEAERRFLEDTVSAVIRGRTADHYPAPPAILEAVLEGCAAPLEEAGAIEGRMLGRLAGTPVARHLVRVFRIGERNRIDNGVGPGATVAIPFERPAVVGAGIMGAGIAAAHLRADIPMTLYDVAPQVLARAVPEILVEAAGPGADPARLTRVAGRLQTATRAVALSGADLVVESVLERTDVKRRVLAEIESIVAADTVIATNTSTNPITRLGESLRDPTRFCGMHFFNPVRRMMLVEVVRGPQTSDMTVARAVAHAKRLGKCPIVVRDSPGFLVNRMLMPYLHEAVEMLREGIGLRRIDGAARAFGMPLGPLELYDLIGLDTAFYAGLVLAEAYADRIEPSPVVPAMVKSGRLGRKSAGGFYRYERGGAGAKAGFPDDGVASVVAPYALPSRGVPGEDAATITDRLLLPMVLEATLVLDEGIVRDSRDIDIAVIHALGFPPFRGGLLAWADSLGADAILERLAALADLGARMRPTPMLEALARSGGRFTGD